MSDEKDPVSFGFETVTKADKTRRVKNVFNAVAQNYDTMNDLMSLGIQRLWKQEFVDWLQPTPDMLCLDVAGGTGDIAFRIIDKRAASGKAPPITVCDINAAMLTVGRERAQGKSDYSSVRFICGDAEALPFPSAFFDAYTISFGIRNVTRREKALEEAYRVLKPGGRFLCLEFSKVEDSLFEKIYDLWSFNAIPLIGQAVAHDRAAYEYLVESIRRFPHQEPFAQEIRTSGFRQVKWRNMTGGVVAMHSGWKL